jgi:hypothetical protein
MEPTFEQIFGDKSAMRLWFANLILHSVALTVADSYIPFTDIGCERSYSGNGPFPVLLRSETEAI